MQDLIERLPLIQSAQAILRDRHLLIEAAAGYGKSVLLKQIVSYLPDAAYLRLTIDDNDVAVLRQRIQTAAARVLLLDDVHLISAESDSVAHLTELLEAGEQTLLMAGRFLPFATDKLIAYGLITLWHHEKLAFAPQTTALLLQDSNVAWHELLSGWPMGVGLLQQVAPAQRSITDAQGKLFDYLAQAVFDGLSPSLQHFLRVMAVTIEFSAELAAHLLRQNSTDTEQHIDTLRQRNLFLKSDGIIAPLRFHDLFRTFLLTLTDRAERATIAQATIGWIQDQHHANDATPAAIEQALDAGLDQEAAKLLVQIDRGWVHNNKRYRSYLRWFNTIAEPAREQFPDLYNVAGHFLSCLPERTSEAFALYDHAESLALAQAKTAAAFIACFERLYLRHMLHGLDEADIVELELLAQRPIDEDVLKVRPLLLLGGSQAARGRFVPARRSVQTAYAIAARNGSPDTYLVQLRELYALWVLIPLGEFAAARFILENALTVKQGLPGPLMETLGICSDLAAVTGDWDNLAQFRAQMLELSQQLPDVDSRLHSWGAYYDGMLAFGQNDLNAADAHFCAMLTGTADERVSMRFGRIITARKSGNLGLIDTLLAESLEERKEQPYLVAVSSLEHDIAHGLAAVNAGDPVRVSAETLNLYRYRTRGDLLRLRALITVACHHQQQTRWQRFARITLRELKQPLYSQLLTQRDGELGAFFWRLLLIENKAVAKARTNLIEIGLIEPLLPLLGHAEQRLRYETAGILAKIGDERAMGALGTTISTEKDKSTKDALQKALNTLESLPPPPLHIKLMGSFHVQRGNIEISNFHRPIVIRLLQYFAINHGRNIPRDQILEALWPDTPPDKAWTTFRTVYSRLRNALEPHMRSKGPNRYFALDGDSYTFDPHGRVTTDIGQFEADIRVALDAGTPLESAMVECYQAVLPELPYADWLLETRARVQELYLTAGQRLGQELLARGELAEAQRWAQRVLSDAPWMEDAWQLLMRVYDRQNQRGRALRAYADAKAALQTELAVDPSPLTEWLYKRLRAGEKI